MSYKITPSWLYTLATQYLGFTDFGTLHKYLCYRICEPRKSQIRVILIPRGFFKTSLFTYTHNIALALENPNIRILQCSGVLANAKIMVMKLGKYFTHNELFRDRFKDFCPKNPENPETTWTGASLYLPNRTTYHAEGTFEAFGADSTIVSRHYDYMKFDDIVTPENCTTKEQMDKIITFVKEAFGLCDNRMQTPIDIIGCMPSSVNVLTDSGEWKNINKICKNDYIYSYNTNKNQIEIDKIKDIRSQGLREIYELKTTNSIIKATGNHPFLKVRGPKYLGKKKIKNPDTKKEWIRLDKLKKGQYILNFKRIDDNSKKSNYSEEFMWFFGFLMGDGWVSVSKSKYNSEYFSLGFSLGIDEEINNRAINYLKDNVNSKVYKSAKGTNIRCDNSVFAQKIYHLGLDKRAKDKLIPNWIFKEPLRNRKSFIKGLIDADGWKAYELLIEDLKRLCNISGYRTSNITYREEVFSCTWNLQIKEIDEQFQKERIVSIKKLKEKEEVFDLSIEKNKNFIAEGLISHNTTWDDGDLYAHYSKKFHDALKAEVEPEIELIKIPATYQKEIGNTIGITLPFKEGESIFPERYSTDELKKIEKEDPETYAKFYQLDPVPMGDRTFTDFTYYDDLPGDYNTYRKFMTVDPAPTKNPTSSYSAINITGVDNEKNMFCLLSWRDKLNPDKLIDKIWDFYFKYNCECIGIEKYVYQIALKYWLYERIVNDKENKFMKIIELDHKGQSKEDHISALAPYVNSGKYKFLQSQNTLIYSLSRFPKSKDRDEADCAAYQLKLVKPSGYKVHVKENLNSLNNWRRKIARLRGQNRTNGLYVGA